MKVIMMIVSLIMSVCFGDVGGISVPGLDGMFGKKEVVKVKIMKLDLHLEETHMLQVLIFPIVLQEYVILRSLDAYLLLRLL